MSQQLLRQLIHAVHKHRDSYWGGGKVTDHRHRELYDTAEEIEQQLTQQERPPCQN